MSFATTLLVVLAHEGGYGNDPNDRGGETFRGISRRANPGWPGWPPIDMVKRQVGAKAEAIDEHFRGDPHMENLVAELYRTKYYNPVARFSSRERPVDKMFEAGVNIGPGGAIRIAQRIVGTKADGAVGPMTLAAATTYFAQPGAEDIFISTFCHLQLEGYIKDIARNPSQLKYINGWTRRAAWRPAA